MQRLEEVRFGDPDAFRSFVETKHRRPTRDLYAAFQRAANWDIIFQRPDSPWPLGDGTVACAHGLDTLRRYRQDALLGEALRVTRSSGVVIFPHVHLTNAEPDPYFARGCLQRHGTEYRSKFATRLRGSGRAAVLLFERPETLSVLDGAETRHYKALVAIVPERLRGRRLEKAGRAVDSEARLIANPFFAIDLDRALTQAELPVGNRKALFALAALYSPNTILPTAPFPPVA
ncbi:MAG: hypothetical protein P8R42_04725 [Candidatus Binatia bacterium]|nr:hypothetical protein [Candidatus Binatia bacterium]